MATFPYACRLTTSVTSCACRLCTVAPMDFSAPPTPEKQVPSDGWRTVSALTWSGVVGSLLAVAISSRTIGRPIWWLGPTSQPASPLWLIVPICLVALPIITTLRFPHRMVITSWVCSVGVIAIGLVDISSTPAIALAVVVIGIAALMESIAVVMVMRHYR